MEEFRPGDRYDKFGIIREIGRGQFGQVYLASDERLLRQVALKVFPFPTGLPGDAGRQLEEARLTARVKSPNVVMLHEIQELPDGSWLFVMEYISGGTLANHLKGSGSLSPSRKLAILRGVATGLQAAHEAGVVHGDLKPANILLDREETPKLVDFGLGRLIKDPGLEASSREGGAGTPRWMAPELFMGQRATKQSDYWAFGVIAFEMFAGHHPYLKEDRKLVDCVFFGDPASLPADAPAALEPLLASCLQRDEADRPRSPEELLSALDGSAASTRGRVVVPPRRPIPALEGRAEEVQQLERLMRPVLKEGAGAAVVLTGEAGIGKTALLRSIRESADKRQRFVWLELQCSPVEGLLRPLCDGIRALMAGSAVEEEKSAHRLFTEFLDQDRPLVHREQLLWSMERLLLTLARRHPLGLVIEDAHQLCSEDIKVIEGLARRLESAPVFLAVSFRTHDPAGPADASAGPHRLTSCEEFATLDLGPLSTEAVLSLLEKAHGGSALAPGLARVILDLSEGNPLYAKQLLAHMLERGTVETREGRLIAGSVEQDRPIPERIRGLVRKRLEFLTEEQRALLDVAALDGVAFDSEAVAAVLELPHLKALRVLQTLYRVHGLLAVRDEALRLSHALIREVILQEVAPPLRRELHARLATHYEARADRSNIPPERLANHWESAGDCDRARPYWLAAARDADARQEAWRTVELFRKARLEEIRPRTPQTVDDYLALADAHFDLGEIDKAELIHDRVIEAATDELQRLRTVVRGTKMRFFYRGHESVSESALRRAADVLPEGRELALARFDLGLLAKYRGRYAEAKHWFGEADTIYRRIGRDAGHSDVLDQLGTLAKIEGDLEAAEGLYGEAADVSWKIGRGTNATVSEVNRCLVRVARGSLDGLEDPLRRAIRFFELAGARNHAAHTALVLASVTFSQGKIDESREVALGACRVLDEEGYRPAQVETYALAAEHAAIRGIQKETNTYLRKAREAAQSIGRRSATLHLEGIATLCFAMLGQATAALEHGRRGIEFLDEAASGSDWDGLVGRIAEAMIYGLDPAILASLPADRPDIEDSSQAILAAHAGRWAAPLLEAAAESLLDSRNGSRRATREILGRWLRARGQFESGDRRAALRELQAAREHATRIQHKAARDRLFVIEDTWRLG